MRAVAPAPAPAWLTGWHCPKAWPPGAGLRAAPRSAADQTVELGCMEPGAGGVTPHPPRLPLLPLPPQVLAWHHARVQPVQKLRLLLGFCGCETPGGLRPRSPLPRPLSFAEVHAHCRLLNLPTARFPLFLCSLRLLFCEPPALHAAARELGERRGRVIKSVPIIAGTWWLPLLSCQCFPWGRMCFRLLAELPASLPGSCRRCTRWLRRCSASWATGAATSSCLASAPPTSARPPRRARARRHRHPRRAPTPSHAASSSTTSPALTTPARLPAGFALPLPRM